MNHSLIAAINYATDNLGLYRAELARILGLMCGDVAESRQLEILLDHNPESRKQAERFVFFASRLEMLFSHDRCRMTHWFRTEHKILGTSPFLAMVDENRLEEVISVITGEDEASGNLR